MTQSLKTTQRAFSLVELSIVLVILGLLVGGVLSGQSLIRASELRSVTSEYQRFATAIGSFRDKYFALPGDMSNATSFWSTPTNIGNGDGNGQVNNTATNTTNEVSQFWAHLANAQLVEGSYTIAAFTTTSEAPGTNVPRAKMSNAGWHIVGLGTVSNSGVPSFTNATAASAMYEGTFGNAFTLGGGSNGNAPTGILKAEEAWNVDTKVDDGKPQTGTVTALESQGAPSPGGCGNAAATTAATASSVAYDLANTSSTACTLVFKSGY